jgi:ABC-type Fe3+ transport system permease subunit
MTRGMRSIVTAALVLGAKSNLTRAAFFGPAPDVDAPPNLEMRYVVSVLLGVGGIITVLALGTLLAALIRRDRERTSRLLRQMREQRDG